MSCEDREVDFACTINPTEIQPHAALSKVSNTITETLHASINLGMPILEVNKFNRRYFFNVMLGIPQECE